MKPKAPTRRSVSRRNTKLRWASIYLLMSEDAREIGVVSIADAPQQLTEFLDQIEKWLQTMREQSDALEQLQRESEGESVQ